jgi:hypothetical protein
MRTSAMLVLWVIRDTRIEIRSKIQTRGITRQKTVQKKLLPTEYKDTKEKKQKKTSQRKT